MRFVEEPNQLTIKLEGLEQLWALKRRLQIPVYAIADVDYVSQHPAMRDYQGYFRVPGTFIPGVFAAGTYWRRGEREFWYLKMRTPGVMTIFLKPGTLRYDKISISCTPELAQDIADWWRNKK